jgi:hypothetical protein
MDNKFLVPFAVAGLTVAFAVISFLVFISRGKNALLLKKKLRFGALLLILTGAAIGCKQQEPFCYSPARLNQFYLQYPTEGGLVVNLARNDTLSGTIKERTLNEFSFALILGTDSILQKNNIYPLDGKFDSTTEHFKIVLDGNIPTGYYDLQFYGCEKDSIQVNWGCLDSYYLQIIGRDSL